ncbi:MAG TPA: TetR/AcrR family transcriptional regulator [Polyangiaceae bacterium]
MATRRGPTPPPRPYHHGDLRRALLDAALELSQGGGAGALSFREIARKVGVSQTAPYRHFRDLEELLAAAAEEGLVALRIELGRAFDEDAREPPLTRLERLTTAYVRFSLRHRGYFHIMFGPDSPRRSATPTLQAAARDTFQLFLSKVHAAWPAPSPNGIDARAGTLHLWVIAHGVATLALEGRAEFLGLDSNTAEALSASVVRTHLAGIASPRQAPKASAMRRGKPHH